MRIKTAPECSPVKADIGLPPQPKRIALQIARKASVKSGISLSRRPSSFMAIAMRVFLKRELAETGYDDIRTLCP
jgi:hypothetical protein